MELRLTNGRRLTLLIDKRLTSRTTAPRCVLSVIELAGTELFYDYIISGQLTYIRESDGSDESASDGELLFRCL